MTSLATDRDWLAAWLQPQHTSPEATDRLHAAFTGSDTHLLVVPDFLVPGVAERIADFLETDAVFTPRCAVWSNDPATAGKGDDAHGYHESVVTVAEWQATPPELRFLRFSVGPGQPTRMSVGWMRFLALRAALLDSRFAQYFEAVTGLPLGGVSSMSAHAMAAGDMLGAHNDVNANRRLAFILYFSRDWQAAYGGSLLVTGMDGAVTTIVPGFNTLVIFEVSAHKSHRVETVSDAAGTARRLSISGWFDHPAPLAGTTA